MKEVFIGESAADSFVKIAGNNLTINDVCIIDPLLTFGPIKNGPISIERKEYFRQNYPKGADWETFSEVWRTHEKFELNAQNLLKEEEVRIWYSEYPADLAGFYYLCSLLDGKNIKVNVVDEYDYLKNKYNHESKWELWLGGWGSYPGKEIKEATIYTKPVSQDEIHITAEKWRLLKEENQYVRTVIDGELISDYPDYRDGLTSIQKSILQSVFEIINNNNDSRYQKSSVVIGQTMGCYELHSAFLTYSHLVKMVQNFNCPYPLLLGLGDFGTRDKTQPDCYRITGVKFSKYGKAMVENIYTGEVYESIGRVENSKFKYLSGLFPNIFCNGNSNLLSHDYENVIKMLETYIDNPDIEEEKLIELIGKPKFADERILLNSEVLSEIYKTGKGIIKYKYADSETVHEDKIEYVLMKDGKPVLMNLKYLVSVYIEHCNNVLARLRQNSQNRITETKRVIQIKETVAKNFKDIISYRNKHSEFDYPIYMKRKYKIDFSDLEIVDKMTLREISGDLSLDYDRLHEVQEESFDLKERLCVLD